MDEQRIIRNMRARMDAGQSFCGMLRWMADELNLVFPNNMELLQAAFFFEFSELAILGGWSTRGWGEVSDARVESFLTPILWDRKERWTS